MNFEAIEHKLKKELSPKRYRHTIGVMYTAAGLAMRYECDINKAMLAGLLHDCTKCISAEGQIKLCNKYHIETSAAEINNPSILHQKTGALVAREKYEVEDEEVLHAISVHTTGCKDMNLLDKIIFISDFIEPGRNKVSNLDQIRKLAFIDIDQCLLVILRRTLEYLNSIGIEIDPITQQVFDYYNQNDQVK